MQIHKDRRVRIRIRINVPVRVNAVQINGTPVVKLNLTLILSVILTLLIRVEFFELNQQLGMRQSLGGWVREGPMRSGAVNSQTAVRSPPMAPAELG